MKRRKLVLNIPASVTPDMLAQLRAILEGPAKAEERGETKPGEWMPGSMAEKGMQARILPGACCVGKDNPGDTFIIYVSRHNRVWDENRWHLYSHGEIEVRWPVAKSAEAVEPEPVWRPIMPEDVALIKPGDKLKVSENVCAGIRFGDIVTVERTGNPYQSDRIKVDSGVTCWWVPISKLLTCLPPAPKPEPEPTPAREFITVNFYEKTGEKKVFGSWQPLTAENIARVKVGDRVRIDGKESATVTAAYPVVERVQLLVDENGNASPFLRWEFCGDSDWQCDAKFFIPDGDNE